jgi:hypothetical protein
VDDDQVPEDLRPYLRHPVAHAQAAARGGVLAKRRAPPVRRSPNGHWETGCSGNPNGRPKGRTTVRKAFHQFGLAAVAKLAALGDDPRLTPAERAAVLSECVQLSYAVRGIRSDASMQRKLEQQQREREMDEAVMDFFRRVQIPPGARLPAPVATQPKSEPAACRPAAPPVPAPRNEAQPPPASSPPAPSVPEAAGGEAEARSDGEVEALPDRDPPAGPGQAPQRPFRITLPF